MSHDSAGVLPACLAALREAGLRPLVVDNASQDGSADLARRLGARVLSRPRNEGYGRANNAGLRALDGALALVLNPDVVLDRAAPARLVAAAARYPDAALFAPRILEPDGRFFFQPRSLLAPEPDGARAGAYLPEGDACAPFLSGACLLLRRDVVLGLGGFDEAIFLFYEDDDLCFRLRGRGHALVHVHDAVARHARGASSAPAPGRIFRSRWHQAWSRSYVARKHGLPDPAPAMAALGTAKALAACLSGRRRLIERHAGTAAGAWAAWRGRPAHPADAAAR